MAKCNSRLKRLTKKRIGIFTGTRAEYGLLYWLIKDINHDPSLELKLIVSGMHLSHEFGETYKQIEQDGFHIDEKVEILLSSDSPIGTAKAIGLGVIGFAEAFTRLSLDSLVILGDRFEALAAAQTAVILNIPIIHLHGGEITEGAFDDSLRHAITKLSLFHGASTNEHAARVIQLGENPKFIKNVGALGLDHIKRTKLYTKKELETLLCFDLKSPFFVVAYHPETLNPKRSLAGFKELLNALSFFPSHKIIFTYPNADAGSRQIITMLKKYKDINPSRVSVNKSLGQKKFLSAIKFSDAILGNSSSGIIEAPSLNTPTVNIGDRQKNRQAGNSIIHCKPNCTSIKDAINLAITGKYKAKNEKINNPYGQGNASQKIIKMIKSIPVGYQKKFFDIKLK